MLDSITRLYKNKQVIEKYVSGMNPMQKSFIEAAYKTGEKIINIMGDSGIIGLSLILIEKRIERELKKLETDKTVN